MVKLSAKQREKLFDKAVADKKLSGGTRRTADTLMDESFKRIEQPMCEQHYMQYMFNLLPYRCTKQCVKERQRGNRYPLKADDFYVYFSQIAVTGGGRPICGWCGKRMRPATEEPKLRELQISAPFGGEREKK
jgi:hypothetical protein